MKALSAADARALAEFLASPERPDDTLPYHGLQGFFFTLACAPELVQPAEWLPVVFGDDNPGFSDDEETRVAMERILGLYNHIMHQTLEGDAGLPADCEFREEVLANLEEDAPISQWSSGFLRGHSWLEEDWDNYLPESLEEGFGANLLALSFFSSTRLAEAFSAEFKPPKRMSERPSLEHVASVIREMFPHAVTEYAALGRSIQKARREIEEVEHIPRRHVKVGRNDPCPCGSGKKYKKCCGAH